MSFQPSNRNQFVWTVPNFSGRTQKSKTHFFSAVFHCPHLFQTEWKMKIGVNGEDTNHSTSVYMKRCHSASDTGPTDLFLQMEICILDAEQKEHFKHYKKCNFKKGRKRGFPYFVERKRIIESRNALLQEDTLTLQCCLWKCPLDEIVPLITHYSAKVSVEQLSFMWTLGWFREWELEVKRSILMVSDLAVNGFELYGTLELESDGQDAPTVVLCLRVAPMAVNEKQLFVAGTISALDYLHRPSLIVTRQHYFEAGSNNAWQFARIFKTHLADPKKHILDFNTLKLKCEFSIADGNRARRTRDHLTPLVDVLRNDEKTLVADVTRFGQADTFPDVQLKIGKETFPAHRMILSARSPVFYEALSRAEYKRRSREGTLPIHSAESDGVEKKGVEEWTLPLYDTDSDTPQQNAAQMSSHRASSLDDFEPDLEPDYDGVAINATQNSSYGASPLCDDDSGSDSDTFPKRVNRKKGCRTPLNTDSDSESNTNISPEPDNGDASSERSDESQSSARIEIEDRVNAKSTVSLSSSGSESEDDRKGADESSPASPPPDDSASQCVETEPVSDGDPETRIDERRRTSPLGDSVSPWDETEPEFDHVQESPESPPDDSESRCDFKAKSYDVPEIPTSPVKYSESQCVVTDPESDDVPESPESPLDDSESRCDYKDECDDSILESSNDITISFQNGSYVAEISRMSRYTLQQMVLCMYTDSVDNMDIDNAVTLFRAGVKYDFQLLRDKCECLLICAINIRTVYYLLLTSDCATMLKLKEAVLNFIEKNSEAILLSDEWQEFLDKHKELGTNTLRYLRNRKYQPV